MRRVQSGEEGHIDMMVLVSLPTYDNWPNVEQGWFTRVFERALELRQAAEFQASRRLAVGIACTDPEVDLRWLEGRLLDAVEHPILAEASQVPVKFPDTPDHSEFPGYTDLFEGVGSDHA